MINMVEQKSKIIILQHKSSLDFNAYDILVHNENKFVKFYDLYFKQGSSTNGTKGVDSTISTNSTSPKIEEEIVKDTNSTKSTSTKDKGEAYSDDDLIIFVKEKGKNGYPMEEFIQKRP